MSWSRNQPAEPGWYVCRVIDLDEQTDRFDRTEIYKISIVDGKPMYKHHQEFNNVIQDGKYRQIWWLGPLLDINESLIVRQPAGVES